MFGSSLSSVHVATSIADALGALADGDAALLAGGTWLMRAPIRGETAYRRYVALGLIEELRRIEIDAGTVSIGACATHMELVAALGALPECEGLVAAARAASNPAIRHWATVGGNLCAWQFAASDLVPALLCLDAEVELHDGGGLERMALGTFLAGRERLGRAVVMGRVVFARRQARYAHVRLPLRKAGDYPVAIVSAAAAIAIDGSMGEIRIAVGSVEPVARRWHALEQACAGRALDPEALGRAARERVGEFTGRDGVEAEGWYRTEVLPTLVRRAAVALQDRA